MTQVSVCGQNWQTGSVKLEVNFGNSSVSLSVMLEVRPQTDGNQTKWRKIYNDFADISVLYKSFRATIKEKKS